MWTYCRCNNAFRLHQSTRGREVRKDPGLPIHKRRFVIAMVIRRPSAIFEG